jgi:hypothetical protein
MKLLDSSAISYILERNISPKSEYFITPDIAQEMEVAELVYNRGVSKNIKNITVQSGFDEAVYLNNYYSVLNKYSKRSFFNMSGFGDVSLVALTITLLQHEAQNTRLPLPGFDNDILVYTNDDHLKSKIISETKNMVKVSNNFYEIQ